MFAFEKQSSLRALLSSLRLINLEALAYKNNQLNATGNKMKKTLLKLTPIALAVTTLTACSPASETAKTAPEPIKTEQPAGQSESERLNAFFERTFEEDLKRSPLLMKNGRKVIAL